MPQGSQYVTNNFGISQFELTVGYVFTNMLSILLITQAGGDYLRLKGLDRVGL